jgi:hypothetical protein
LVEAEVLANSSDQDDTAIQKAENSSIAKAGIDDGPDDSILPGGDALAPLAQGVEQLAPWALSPSSCCLLRNLFMAWWCWRQALA